MHRARVARAQVDTLERVERALYDLGIKYLPIRIRDAITDGIQWAYRAAMRPVARASVNPVEVPFKPYEHPRRDSEQQDQQPRDGRAERNKAHRSAIVPPKPRVRQNTMEIRPEDMIWPDEDDDPTDPYLRLEDLPTSMHIKPKG